MRRTLYALGLAIFPLVSPTVLSAQYQWTLVIGNGPKPVDYSSQGIERFTFVCQPNLPVQSVYGTDVYTDDTNICSAAVHAGAITRARGGAVTLEIRDGHTLYEGSLRNGIASEPYYKSHNRGYSFLSEQGGVLDWRTTAGQLHRSFTAPVDLVCPPASPADLQLTPVYGTDIYKDDSSICGAAVHAGSITLAGGRFRFLPRGPQMSFAASARNGVASKIYGTYDGSFSVGAVARMAGADGKDPAQTGGSTAGAPGVSTAAPPTSQGSATPPSTRNASPGKPGQSEKSGSLVAANVGPTADRFEAVLGDVIRNGMSMRIETLDSIVGAVAAEQEAFNQLVNGGWIPTDGYAAITRLGNVADSLDITITRIVYNRLTRLWISNTDTHVFPILAENDMSVHVIPNLQSRARLVPSWRMQDPSCSAILGPTSDEKYGVRVPFFNSVSCSGSRVLLMTITGPPGSMPASRTGLWDVGR